MVSRSDLGLGLEVDGREQLADGLGAHAAAEVHAVAEGAAVLLFHLAEERLVGDDVALLDALEGGPQLAQARGLLIGVALQVAQTGVGLEPELAGPLLDLFLGPLAERGLVEAEGDLVVLVGRGVAEQHRHALVALGHDLDLLLVARDEGVLDVGLHQILELARVALPLLVVDEGDDGGREVEDPLQLLGRDVEQVAHAAGDALEVPDVADRRGQVDVAHALAAHLGPA